MVRVSFSDKQILYEFLSSILVHCEKGDWGSWTPCSKSCEKGEKTRQRDVLIAAAFGGNECTEDMKETEVCRTQKCPST